MKAQDWESLCDVDDCAADALWLIKAHRRSDPLLGQLGKAVCSEHFAGNVWRAAEELRRDNDLYGITIMTA